MNLIKPYSLLLAAVTPALLPFMLEAGTLRGKESRQWLRTSRYPVASRSIVLVDKTRPTSANREFPGAPTRTLETTVWYPTVRRSLDALRPGPAPVATAGGPFPLIIYNHGFLSFRSEGAHIAAHLAGLGYVVVAADFPLTTFWAPGRPSLLDVVNQPGDVSFLMDTWLRYNRTEGNAFQGKLDESRVGLVGLSLGGLTTSLTTFHPRLRDPRVAAAISIAGPAANFTPSFYQTTSVPYMVIAADTDAIVDYSFNARPILERLPSATLVTIRQGSHTGFAHIAATAFALSRNPDTIGCHQLMTKAPPDPKGLDDFIRPEDGLVQVATPTPCDAPRLPRAIRPAKQQALTTLAVASFFEGVFHQDERVRAARLRYLMNAFPAENEDVAVAGGRPEPRLPPPGP